MLVSLRLIQQELKNNMTAKIKKKPRIDWKTVKLSPEQQLRAVSLIKLGHFILSKYSLPSWVTVDDRTDIVNLAVVKCSATFDASKRRQQSTWLSWYIMSCVREFTNPRLVGDIQRLKEKPFSVMGPSFDACCPEREQHKEEIREIWNVANEVLIGPMMTVFRLRFKEGRTVKETAKFTGKSPEYVRQMEARAIDKIRRIVKSNLGRTATR
jgi:RNA polymerase sigma factor (sigma-70 family)